MPPTGQLLHTSGVITNTSDYLRGTGALKVGNNVNIARRGILTNRFSGWKRQHAAAINSGADFKEFGAFVSPTGLYTMLFQVGDKLYQYDPDTDTPTVVISGLGDDLPCMRMYMPYVDTTPYMVYCNGEQPKKVLDLAPTVGNLQLNGADWNTTTLTGSLPAVNLTNPRFCDTFLDRMIYAGFEGNAAYYVAISNSGDAEVITSGTPLEETDGGIFQLDPLLGFPTGVKTFKLSNETSDQIAVIGQERGVSIIVGSSALDFQNRVITREHGILSNRTWIYLNNSLFFLATDGIRLFDTLYANASLVNSTVTNGLLDLVNRINLTYVHAQKAHAVHVPFMQEVQFWFPIDANTTCSNAFILSYNNEASDTAIAPCIFTKDGTDVAASAYLNGAMYGGNYQGILQKHHQGNLYDDVPVPFTIVPALVRADDPNQTFSVAKYQPITEGAGQKYVVNNFYLGKLGNGAMARRQSEPHNFVVSSSDAGSTALDSWVLGAGSFPASMPRMDNYYPDGVGFMHELQISGNQSDHFIDLLGINYTITPKDIEP